jgi:hypothetical protein
MPHFVFVLIICDLRWGFSLLSFVIPAAWLIDFGFLMTMKDLSAINRAIRINRANRGLTTCLMLMLFIA